MTNGYSSIESMTDEQLVFLAKSGDDRAMALLISRIVPIVKSKVSKFSASSLPSEDLAQEGMIGFLSAIYSYDANSNASFKTFAGVCISNRISSAIKSYSRKKNMPLNKFVPLDDENLEMADYPSPEDIIIANDEFNRISKLLKKNLSDFELKVINLYISGKSYEDIAGELYVLPKSIDNAMQRIRKKLKVIS